MSNERVILCGGATPPRLWRNGPAKTISLNLWGRESNIGLQISDISERMVADIPTTCADLLEVATYVYCADQAVTRGGNGVANVGAKWRRTLKLAIPVREPELWSTREVKETLQDTLGFISDDTYQFKFTKLSDPSPIQQYIRLASGPGLGFDAQEVVLFSGGLDSLAGAIQETHINGRRTALVSHRSVPTISSRQKDLVKELRERFPEDPQSMHIPVWISKDKGLSREYSQRTRSFLYAALGVTVAGMFGLSRVRIYENGIISLNLPISAQLVGARASRTTHPQTLEGLSRFFSCLTGSSMVVENPFLWKTKAEVVGLMKHAGSEEMIKNAVSCSQTFGRTRLHTHCGKCIQCIDRRFAILATGCEKHDPEEMYEVDLLAGERREGHERTMVESYVRRAREIGGMSDSEFFGECGEASRVFKHLEGDADTVARQILDLHKRHADQITDVVKEGIQQHIDEILNEELPDSCLLVLAFPKRREVGPQTGFKHEDCVFKREGGIWTIAFKGETLRLQGAKGLQYISHLLHNPAREIHVIELVTAIEERDPITVGRAYSKMSEEQLGELGLSTADLGDAGEILDDEALAAYRNRMKLIEEELQEAEKNDDISKVAKLKMEKKALEEQLSSALGLNGRKRKSADPNERARKAVSAAIRRSMNNIQKHHAALWRHLSNSLHVGEFCIYSPEPPTTWET